MGVGTVFIVGTIVKIATVCGIGIGTSSLLNLFHTYEIKSKGGDSNGKNSAKNVGKLLREKSRNLY